MKSAHMRLIEDAYEEGYGPQVVDYERGWYVELPFDVGIDAALTLGGPFKNPEEARTFICEFEHEHNLPRKAA